MCGLCHINGYTNAMMYTLNEFFGSESGVTVTMTHLTRFSVFSIQCVTMTIRTKDKHYLCCMYASRTGQKNIHGTEIGTKNE